MSAKSSPVTWNVSRFSRSTDRLVKVVGGPFATFREAELWLEGFGPDKSKRTILRVCPSQPVKMPKDKENS